ncbi:MAG TPA: COX15/CtaA family protein [Methylomirabilota bacterium]|jgi:cytochrome c oxidase assembly protein subunit 15|nr:COX15/CtaA family protein [Methylomirabilota bacterium]
MAVAPAPWAHRLAVVLSGATLLLIVAGGLVTNTGAALAVPDWPTTFGHNMFLFPWSGMVGGVFYEHTHRLLGAVVGVLTLALAAVLWLADDRRWLRGLGLVAIGLVVLQGLLGGLRVLLLRETLAIVHGCLAQAFFAFTVALALVTSGAWRAPAAPLPSADRRALARLSAAGVAALFGQIVLGALTTHGTRPGWVALHLAGAVIAAVAAGGLAFRVLARHAGQDALAWLARVLIALLGVQLALGLGAYVARFTAAAVPGGPAVALALPVAHRAIASLLLGAAVALALESWRRAPSTARRGVRSGAVAREVPA